MAPGLPEGLPVIGAVMLPVALPVSTSYWNLSSVLQVDHLPHKRREVLVLSSPRPTFLASLAGSLGKDDMACIKLVGCIFLLESMEDHDVAPVSKS